MSVIQNFWTRMCLNCWDYRGESYVLKEWNQLSSFMFQPQRLQRYTDLFSPEHLGQLVVSSSLIDCLDHFSSWQCQWFLSVAIFITLCVQSWHDPKNMVAFNHDVSVCSNYVALHRFCRVILYFLISHRCFILLILLCVSLLYHF